MGYSYGYGFGHTWKQEKRVVASAPAGVAPSNTTLPVISGTPTVGETIATTAGVWDGVPSPTYAYQWKRAGASISGATANTYTLVALDTAALITVTVTATNASGSASATSASFGTINLTPSNAVEPVISGTITVGQTLTSTTGTWAGTPVPTYTYQWKRDGSNISSATSSTYVLVTADANTTITCAVTGTNTAGSASATSNSLGPINIIPANTVAPVISGTITVGQTLTSTTGTWTGTPTPTYTYQWKRDGSNIGSATASTYVLVSADAGTNITCAVTGTNSVGAASATSNSLGPVILIPANTVAPVISGTVTVGQTLTSTTGTWTGYPTPTYTYQWKRGGVSIGSATASTYVLVIADVATNITCTVTGTNTAGAASATSNSLGPVIAGGAEVLGAETDGWATDFIYATDANRVAKIVSGTITYYALDDFFLQTGTSPKYLFDVTGARVWTPHNMFVNSGTPATQSVTTVIGQAYIVTVTGSGSLAGSSGASGTASAGSPLTYTATGTTSTFTLSGSLTTIQMNRGTTALAYMTSGAASRIGLCIDYDPSTHACKGLLYEAQVTNLILNNAAMSTQNVTVTAVAHTLSFFGTGTVTLTGTSTAGPLTGSSATTKVSLTFTPTAGTLTLTVSGTVTYAQLEIGSFATSTIPTFGATVTRAGDKPTFLLSTIPAFTTEYTLYDRWQTPNTSNNRFPVVITDGSVNEFAGIWATSGTARLNVTDGGSAVGAIVGPSITANTTVSAAARFKANDCALSVGGAAVGTDVTVTLPTVTEVRFGTAGNNVPAGTSYYLEKMAIFPRGFINAELVTKSAT